MAQEAVIRQVCMCGTPQGIFKGAASPGLWPKAWAYAFSSSMSKECYTACFSLESSLALSGIDLLGSKGTPA